MSGKSWPETALSEVCSLVTDGTHHSPPNSAEGDFLYVTAKNIRRWGLDLSDITRVSSAIHDEIFARCPVEQGDVLYIKDGVTAGLAAINHLREPFSMLSSVALLKPKRDLLEPRYLKHWLNSPTTFARMTGEMTGSAIRRLVLRQIRSAAIPLAPLPEQKRIADKLDILLARVDTCRNHLARVPAILKRFRQSVLSAAVYGNLTDDWRELSIDSLTGREVVRLDASSKSNLLAQDQSLSKKKSTSESKIDSDYTFDIPDNWTFTSWGTISEWITYGFTRPMPHIDKGMPLLTARHIHNFAIDFPNADNTTPTAFANLSEKDRPKFGDMLITKDGTIGRAALVDFDGDFCINQSVAVCWLRSTKINKRYLELVANAEFTQQFIRDKAKGMAIQHLSITDFAQCPVPVPPLKEQAEIVRRVESLFALADQLEARYTATRTHIDRLTPALLAKAFRGELVPQDRCGDSAIPRSVLNVGKSDKSPGNESDASRSSS